MRNFRGKIRERDKKYRRKMEKLYEANKERYITPCIYVDEKYDKEEKKYKEIEKPYYKRIYKGKNYTNYKKEANRYIRRNKKEESWKGNGYRKEYDLWWNWI